MARVEKLSPIFGSTTPTYTYNANGTVDLDLGIPPSPRNSESFHYKTRWYLTTSSGETGSNEFYNKTESWTDNFKIQWIPGHGSAKSHEYPLFPNNVYDKGDLDTSTGSIDRAFADQKPTIALIDAQMWLYLKRGIITWGSEVYYSYHNRYFFYKPADIGLFNYEKIENNTAFTI